MYSAPGTPKYSVPVERQGRQGNGGGQGGGSGWDFGSLVAGKFGEGKLGEGMEDGVGVIVDGALGGF